ncbi:MAG TPA: YceI family protein [Acidobacteriaceae bacterium]|nr:YceI family protein [Acidobacteriaceae bacterium]
MRLSNSSLFSTVILAGALVSGVSALAQKTTYEIDPAHSAITFGIKHMAISTVHGRFAIKDGVIEMDPKNLADSSVQATIDVASVDTGVSARDTDLKSPHFFDAEKYPTATFRSTKVVAAGDGYDVIGDLNLHGVTKTVTLHLDPPSKEQMGPGKKPRRGFTATTTIRRQDFGLNWNGTLPSGDAMLGDDVKMEFDIEAAQK